MFYNKNYPLQAIGEVVNVEIARAHKVFKETDIIQYLDISSIDNLSKKVIGLTSYVLKEAPSRAQYILAKNDIVYSTVRPNLKNMAINPYVDKNIIGSTGFCILRCVGVTTGYMWGIVNSDLFNNAMIDKASGANYPAVTDKIVYSYKIPIPPLEQQKEFEQFYNHLDKSKFAIKEAMENVLKIKIRKKEYLCRMILKNRQK